MLQISRLCFSHLHGLRFISTLQMAFMFQRTPWRYAKQEFPHYWLPKNQELNHINVGSQRTQKSVQPLALLLAFYKISVGGQWDPHSLSPDSNEPDAGIVGRVQDQDAEV